MKCDKCEREFKLELYGQETQRKRGSRLTDDQRYMTYRSIMIKLIMAGLNWSFDFNKANKNARTLVFIHGPVKGLPIGCIYCMLDKNIFGYAQNIQPELDKFTNLIGVYSGHVHYDSNQIFNGIRYVTVGGLAKIDIGKYPLQIAVATPSDNVGYSIIKDNKSYYELVSHG